MVYVVAVVVAVEVVVWCVCSVALSAGCLTDVAALLVLPLLPIVEAAGSYSSIR